MSAPRSVDLSSGPGDRDCKRQPTRLPCAFEGSSIELSSKEQIFRRSCILANHACGSLRCLWLPQQKCGATRLVLSCDAAISRNSRVSRGKTQRHVFHPDMVQFAKQDPDLCCFRVTSFQGTLNPHKVWSLIQWPLLVIWHASTELSTCLQGSRDVVMLVGATVLPSAITTTLPN